MENIYKTWRICKFHRMYVAVGYCNIDLKIILDLRYLDKNILSNPLRILRRRNISQSTYIICITRFNVVTNINISQRLTHFNVISRYLKSFLHQFPLLLIISLIDQAYPLHLIAIDHFSSLPVINWHERKKEKEKKEKRGKREQNSSQQRSSVWKKSSQCFGQCFV